MAKTKQAFGEYKCKICSKVFTESGGLSQHIQLHSLDKPFSCHVCSFTCKTKKYLHRHINRVHAKREMQHECDICSKKFLYKSALDKHMYTHTNERPFKCEVCNKGFNSRYSLSSHRHTHTGAKPYKCSYCDYACRDNSTLRKHRERHTGVTRLYQCTACDKSYKTKRILKIHVAEVHMQMEMKTKPCPECGKLFKSLKSLNNHVRMSHLKLYACKCDICGATLSSKYNMRAHLTSHIDYRPFKCSFEGCDKRYKDRGGLKKHTIVHYPEKHFECSVCKKKFSRLHRMYQHKKQHKAKKKSVFCDYCGKGFYNKNYIRSHITRKHMHRQRYICDLCDFITYNKPSIVMHIKHGHVSELDRKCKICKKTYKKHIYLKLHYWNTHSIKYKLNRHTLRKPKEKKENIIIEEDSEPDVKDIELIHQIKVEAMSDTEEIKDDTEYSRGVLSEDMNRAIVDNEVITANKKFKDFFIEQIVMPSSSNDEETQQKETDIYVDVTCQKEAERVRTEMLERWRQNGGVRPFVRLKRHRDATFRDNSLNRVKNEKIEITIFSENVSNTPTSKEVSRKTDANKKKTRKANDCEKINEILEKFNNSRGKIISEDDKISKINLKISKIGDLIQNDFEKNSRHCKKQIIKKLNKALNKYNNLVNKMYDIQNKELQSSPKNRDTTSHVIGNCSIGIPSFSDENIQSSEIDRNSSIINNDGDDDLATIDDEPRKNNEYNGEITEAENKNSDVIIKDDIGLGTIGNEHRKNVYGLGKITSSINNENRSCDIVQIINDQALSGVDDCKELNDEVTSSENFETRHVDIETKNADLPSIADDNRQNSAYDEIIPLDVHVNMNTDLTKTGDDQALIEDDDCMEFVEEMTSLNNGDENRPNSDHCMSFHDEVEKYDERTMMGQEYLKNNDDHHVLNDETTLFENDAISFGGVLEEIKKQVSISDEITSSEIVENITNDSLFEEQVNSENSIGEVNQLNSSNNELFYEKSLAELVKLRKRKCIYNEKNTSNTDAIEINDFIYLSNLKEIDCIIKEIDNMIASIGNDQSNLNNEKNLERLKLLNSTRKRRKQRGKRNIKKKTYSENNKTCKVKKEPMIREDIVETNKGTATTQINEIVSTENYETLINNQSELLHFENHLEERVVNKYCTRRSVRNISKNVNDLDSHNDFDSDDDRDQDFAPDDYDDYESGDEEQNKSNKFKINSHQCYICFKLYETKEKLLDHCKEHFDICNIKMLKKCPFCEYVTSLDLVRHVRLKHKINLNYLYGTLKDRKSNNNKSRFYFNVENNLVNEIEVIPSIKNLNRQAFLKIDRKRRDKNDKEVKKAKLVKKDGEWVVEKVLVNTKKGNYILPHKVEEILKNKEKASKNGENDKNEENGIEKQTENDRDDDENNSEKEPEEGSENEDYCVKMQRLYRIAKKNGQKMLFPCDKCEKICQTLSALKLHLRRHDPNAKPFKKKVWKHKLTEEELQKLQENKEKSKTVTNKNNKNRYEKPKPIVNKHKCDPKLKDFYEKNIKGGDIEFWQFLKIFNKMTRENVNDFSDLESRTEFGNHFIDPELNPPINSSTSTDYNLEKSGSSKTNLIKKPKKGNSAKTNSNTLVGKKGLAKKITKENKFKRTILLSRKDFLRRKAIKDILRKKNTGKSNKNT